MYSFTNVPVMLQIVNDLFAFLHADEVKFDLLNNVLHFLEDETEYAVWYAALRGLNKLRNHYLGSDTLGLIDVRGKCFLLYHIFTNLFI